MSIDLIILGIIVIAGYMSLGAEYFRNKPE